MRCAKVLPRTREPIMLASQARLVVLSSFSPTRHFPVYKNQYGHTEIHPRFGNYEFIGGFPQDRLWFLFLVRIVIDILLLRVRYSVD